MSRKMDYQNAYFFAGGIAVALAGKLLLKSDAMRKTCVSALAQGMRVQKDVKAGLQNLKEDAEDLCYEARVEAEMDQEPAEVNEAEEEKGHEV